MKKLSFLLTLSLLNGLSYLEAQTKPTPKAGQQPANKVNAVKTSADSKLTGSWDVWIQGAVTYTATETAVYQQYSAGAAMNRLDILKDGSYQWGTKKGRLSEVRPWHAQEGRKYYRIIHSNGNEYDFWYDEPKDKLIVLFGEVGGHAATGSRWSEATASNTAGKIPETKIVTKAEDKKNLTLQNQFKKGDKVEIEWKGTWYAGIIIESNKEEYKVSYDGWGTIYDEWVKPSRLRILKK